MNIKMLQIGESGSGKTFNSLSFPKCYYIVSEPGGEDTILSNPELKKNLVEVGDIRPLNMPDVKTKVDSLNRMGEVYKYIDRARQLVKEGKVETLVLDNFTYYADSVWMLIENFYAKTSDRTGKPDTQSMYGELGRRLLQFTLLELTTFPGNLVVNVHIKLEDDEVLQKLPSRDTPIVPSIPGGFRNKIEGLFSLVAYLTRDKQGKFYARTSRGNNRNAKSRYPLEPIIENISYQKIMDSINKNITKK